MLVRAKLQFEGFDDATQSQKPHWESVRPVFAFHYEKHFLQSYSSALYQQKKIDKDFTLYYWLALQFVSTKKSKPNQVFVVVCHKHPTEKAQRKQKSTAQTKTLPVARQVRAC